MFFILLTSFVVFVIIPLQNGFIHIAIVLKTVAKSAEVVTIQLLHFQP